MEKGHTKNNGVTVHRVRTEKASRNRARARSARVYVTCVRYNACRSLSTRHGVGAKEMQCSPPKAAQKDLFRASKAVAPKGASKPSRVSIMDVKAASAMRLFAFKTWGNGSVVR